MVSSWIHTPHGPIGSFSGISEMHIHVHQKTCTRLTRYTDIQIHKRIINSFDYEWNIAIYNHTGEFHKHNAEQNFLDRRIPNDDSFIQNSNIGRFGGLGASLMAQLVKNLPSMWETWVRFLGWEDPLEKGKATHSSSLAWRIPWTVQSMESWTQMSNFHFHFGGLEICNCNLECSGYIWGWGTMIWWGM